MTRNEEGQFDVGGGPLAVLSDETEGPTIERTGMTRGPSIAVQEKQTRNPATPPS